MSDQKHVNVEFFTPEDVGPRVWGREILVALSPGKYIGKLILMNAGTAGGLQKHHLKDETTYLHSGEAWVDFDPGTGKTERRKIVAGQSVRFPPGAVHRVTAITDCVIFEASTPHFNDRVRVEEQYGETIPEGGLPTTRMEDVEIR